MLFLFAMWAADYYGGQEDYEGRYEERDDSEIALGEEDTDFSLPNESREERRSTTTQTFAQGEIPIMLQDELLVLFSDEQVREILDVPDTLEKLRVWRISSLRSSDVSERKKDAQKRATDSLCALLQEKDANFCKERRTLIDRIVDGTFHNVKSVVLSQLLQLIRSTLKEEGQKLTALKKKEIAIQKQGPERKRQMLKERERIREEEKRLDEKIDKLKERLSQPYKRETEKTYDEEALADLKEQKSLLLVEPAHVRRDLKKQSEALEKIKKQKHLIQKDIEKFKVMSKELSVILKERETSASLKKAWNEANAYFRELKENEEKDKRLAEEKERKRVEELAKEESKEKETQNKEMEMFKGLEEKVSTSEAAAEAKKESSLFSQFFQGISSGG